MRDTVSEQYLAKMGFLRDNYLFVEIKHQQQFTRQKDLLSAVSRLSGIPISTKVRVKLILFLHYVAVHNLFYGKEEEINRYHVQ